MAAPTGGMTAAMTRAALLGFRIRIRCGESTERDGGKTNAQNVDLLLGDVLFQGGKIVHVGVSQIGAPFFHGSASQGKRKSA